MGKMSTSINVARSEYAWTKTFICPWTAPPRHQKVYAFTHMIPPTVSCSCVVFLSNVFSAGVPVEAPHSTLNTLYSLGNDTDLLLSLENNAIQLKVTEFALS